MILDYFTSGGHAAEPFEPAHKISRRSFIQAGAAAGGGLMLSLRLPIAGGEAGAANAETFAPNAFIRIDGEGQIVLTTLCRDGSGYLYLHPDVDRGRA